MRDIKVCKFGGSSLSDGSCFRRVRDIIQSDPRRRYIVVSAPGRRFAGDTKITDRLITAYAAKGDEREAALREVKEVFTSIARDLGLTDPAPRLTEIEASSKISRDMSASRGEWLCARMLAEYTCLPFYDAADLFVFRNGAFDRDATYRNLGALDDAGAVIPGFYGADETGKIVTFPRGGSDICGAHAAAALGAAAYENWTDVDGFHTADPCLVPGSLPISRMSYAQARLLSRLGAGVLHYDCLTPAEEARIPIIVKNTFRPALPGTVISGGEHCLMPCIAVSRHSGSEFRLSVTDVSDAQAFEMLHLLPENARASLNEGILTVICPETHLKETAADLHRAVYGAPRTRSLLPA